MALIRKPGTISNQSVVSWRSFRAGVLDVTSYVITVNGTPITDEKRVLMQFIDEMNNTKITELIGEFLSKHLFDL